jgi:hypothetical protein
MNDSPQVLQLLADALDYARTPEEVCAEYPELLAEVRIRWEECRGMNSEIDALFPMDAGSAAPTSSRRRVLPMSFELPPP